MRVLVTAGLVVGALVAMVYVATDRAPQNFPSPIAAIAATHDAAPASTDMPMPEVSSMDQDAPYFEACAREGLSESACVGRLIWFKATAGNERFHTYTFQQRIGVLPDWFRVLRSDQRDDRFRAWGLMNDPACCSNSSF